MLLKLPLQYSYGGLALCISLLNNVFLLFYVTTFVSVFQIDGTSFYIGETIFLIWNSINDPLFGWLSDSGTLECDKIESQNDIILKRINALLKFGPLFALSFLLFWFPLLPVGLQFSVALCLYDSFLTMVDLHHQALLADLTIEAEDRVKLNSYCSMFSAVGSLSVFASFSLWNKDHLIHFQLFCVFLSAFVCFGFYVCCESMKSFCHQTNSKSTVVVPKNNHSMNNIAAVKKYTQQVFQHKNFLIFAVMNLVQVFHCHFNSNFFPLFLQHLLGHTLSPSGGALILGLSFLVPHMNNLYFLQLCKKHGTYFIIRFLFIIKLLLAILMFSVGTSYWYILCLFIVSNRVFTEGTCKLLNLIISDLVDEDYVKFKRKSPVSALVFGTSALLSKPGQTLAPLVGSYLFYIQSGKSLFFDSKQISSRTDEVNTYGVHEPADFKDACFNLLVLVPIACAVIQLFVWKFYTLKGRYLKNIKHYRYNGEIGHYDIHMV